MSNDNEAKLSEYIKVIDKEIEKLIDKIANNTLNMIHQNVYINNYGSKNLTPEYLTGLLNIPFGSTLKLLTQTILKQIPNIKKKREVCVSV